jgi:hypothetical protein
VIKSNKQTLCNATLCKTVYQTNTNILNTIATHQHSLSLRDIALCQTAINTLCHVRGDQRAESINITTVDRDFTSSAAIDDFVLESEVLLSDLSNTGI